MGNTMGNSNTMNVGINTFWTRIIDLYDSYHDFTESRVVACAPIMNNLLEIYYKFITDDYLQYEPGIYSHEELFKNINDVDFKKSIFKFFKDKFESLGASEQFDRRIIQHDNSSKLIKIRHNAEHYYVKRKSDYSIYLENYKVYDASRPGKLENDKKIPVNNDINIEMTGLNVTVKVAGILSTCNDMITLSAGGNNVAFLGIIMCAIISPECFFLKYDDKNNKTWPIYRSPRGEKETPPPPPKSEQLKKTYYYYNPLFDKYYIQYEYHKDGLDSPDLTKSYDGLPPSASMENGGEPFAYCSNKSKLVSFKSTDKLLKSEDMDNIKYTSGNKVFTYRKFPITGTISVSIKKPSSGLSDLGFKQGEISRNYIYNEDNMKDILLCALFSFKRVGDLVPEAFASHITNAIHNGSTDYKEYEGAIGAYVDTDDFWAKLNGLLRGACVISDKDKNDKVNGYYYDKYLKYKNKYLQLKEQISNTIL